LAPSLWLSSLQVPVQILERERVLVRVATLMQIQIQIFAQLLLLPAHAVRVCVVLLMQVSRGLELEL
jgi:hypothetical protein